jgi:hypothetical protein
MMVRNRSHIFPAGAVQRPQPTGGVAPRQAMGTPVTMAREAEKIEPVQKTGAVQAAGSSPMISSGTHQAITSLHQGG